MKPGTREHKELFCRTFIESHREWEPESLAWPQLSEAHLKLLHGIPFWGTARATEVKAGEMVAGFARTIADPLIREAVEVQAVEEARHGRLMNAFVERYALPVKDVDLSAPAPTKSEFVEFGYEECLDAFLGFGLFGIARKRPDFIPGALLDVFENVLVEEARHTTFFVNWFRYEEALAGRDGYLSRTPKMLANYTRSLRRLIASFSGDTGASGFVASGTPEFMSDVTPQMFLESAISEHRRYMAMLDPRLKKPALLPVLSTIALTAMRSLPPRVQTASGLHAVGESERRSAA